jgi:hypothetical protein
VADEGELEVIRIVHDSEVALLACIDLLHISLSEIQPNIRIFASA